jgi:signal transduction histidine kinase
LKNNFLIPKLIPIILAAGHGGSITSYFYFKPSRGYEVEKLGYSNTLDGWQWRKELAYMLMMLL